MVDNSDLLGIIHKKVVSKLVKNKKYIIAANWKMNKNLAETYEFLTRLSTIDYDKRNTVILFPPFPYTFIAQKILQDSCIMYGMQNMSWKASGAFTGEVSPEMALDLGCKYVIIGHSERRSIFYETDAMIADKVYAAVQYGITPILCIGENLDDRNKNTFGEKLESQLYQCLNKVKNDDTRKVIIAYEPVWAIGTGINATKDQVRDTHLFIRETLRKLFDDSVANLIPIIYGGSVKADNVLDIAMIENVSGYLIGGASLDINEFSKIIYHLNGY